MDGFILPIFVEGLIQEFQYPQNSHFLYDPEFWTQCVIFGQSMKIGTHEYKAIHSVPKN